MAWDLQIHHLDVTSTGDCTIIVATDTVAGASRTVLIDAGKGSNNPAGVSRAEAIHLYLTNLGNDVDVIVATHFDNDHYSGIYYLLNKAAPSIYDSAIVYDQGQPPYEDAYYNGADVRNAGGVLIRKAPTIDYLKYIHEINRKPGVTRATLMVNSFDIVRYNLARQSGLPPAPANIPGPGWLDAYYYNGVPPAGGGGGPNNGDVRPVIGQPSLPPDWLVGKEIMWGNGGDNTAGRPAFAQIMPAPAAGHPTLTCICANKWARQNGAANSFVSEQSIFNGPNNRMSQAEIQNVENGYNHDGSGSPNDNRKSLGFLLEFNNFKYYLAGDLEQAQEDGHLNINPAPNVFKNGVMHYANQGNNMDGRVSVIKTSHHGAATATSRDFVTRLRPGAAIISCSNNNQFSHPSQRTVNVLDGYPHQPINAVANNQYKHPIGPPAGLYRQVQHYLTGFQNPGAANFAGKSRGGVASQTAGDPAAPAMHPGHIRLTVSQAESLRPVVGQFYRGVRAATGTINTYLAMGLTAAEVDAIADNAATFGTYAAVTLAAGANILVGINALESAAWVGKDNTNNSVIEDAVAAGNVGAADAAINTDWRVAAVAGLALGIANAVNGQNAATITAAVMGAPVGVGVVVPINTANVAGFAGHHIYQSLGAIPAGYAVTSAIAAINTAPPPSVGQAVAIAAAIAAEIRLTAGAVGMQTITDAIYDTAVAAGLSAARAALVTAVAIAIFTRGDAANAGHAVRLALLKQGTSNANATAQRMLAQAAANINAGNIFNIQLYNANPAPAHHVGNVVFPHTS